MELISLAELSALLQVLIVDLVLAGDNAIVVAMAVVGLPREKRIPIMVMGIAAATLLRVVFALLTVYLLQVTGLLLVGGLLLLWVCWKLGRELYLQASAGHAAQTVEGIAHSEPPPSPARKTTRDAVAQIVIADVSMSLDNVLAVAGIARDHAWVLVVGLAMSIAFMGLAAVFIARLLARYHWIGYLGLAVIFYVAVAMMYEGTVQILGVMG